MAASTNISQSAAPAESPEERCPICLDQLDNPAYLVHCLHKFCFVCILEWGRNKAECPLCKRQFASIIHCVKADDGFVEVHVRPMENNYFGGLGGQSFQYHTMFTEDQQTQRRTSSALDNSLMLAHSVESINSHQCFQSDQIISHMLTRLASLRQALNEGRPVCQIQDMLPFRQALYCRGLRVVRVSIADPLMDISAEFFQCNPACVNQLSPWLKRELMVLFGTHRPVVNMLHNFILSHIMQHDMEGPALQHELQPLLLDLTEHFMHEFISFARSPFIMEAYDLHAIYDIAAPLFEDSNSLVTDTSHNSGAWSPLPWDDETPGPSYVMTAQINLITSDSESESQIPTGELGEPVENNSAAQDSEDATSAEEDCVIVGYVKPWAKWTPEVVELSSDSETSVSGWESKVAGQLQQHLTPEVTELSTDSELSVSNWDLEVVGQPQDHLYLSHSPLFPSSSTERPKERHSDSYNYYKWEKSNMKKELVQHHCSRYHGKFISRSRSRSPNRSQESHHEETRHFWSPSRPISRSPHQSCIPEKPGKKRKRKTWRLEEDSDEENYPRSHIGRVENLGCDNSSKEARSRDRVLSTEAGCDASPQNGTCCRHSRQRKNKKKTMAKKQKKGHDRRISYAKAPFNVDVYDLHTFNDFDTLSPKEGEALTLQ